MCMQCERTCSKCVYLRHHLTVNLMASTVTKDFMQILYLPPHQADYRLDSATAPGDQLLCVSTEGEVRGYSGATGGPGRSLMDSNVEQDTIRELSQRKQNMMLELKNYAENSKIAATAGAAGLAASYGGQGPGGGRPQPGPGGVGGPMGSGGLQPGSSGGFDTSGGGGSLTSGQQGGTFGAPGPMSTQLAGGAQSLTLGGSIGEYTSNPIGMIPVSACEMSCDTILIFHILSHYFSVDNVLHEVWCPIPIYKNVEDLHELSMDVVAHMAYDFYS